MGSDLISRGTAAACAVSGTYRIINGERWIRVSDVRQNLEDIPATETEIVHCRDCVYCLDDHVCSFATWHTTANDYCSKGEKVCVI